MDNDMRNDTNGMMDLDLNQEPLIAANDSMLGLGSSWDEVETTRDQIQERIRQLKAVSARARLRQGWRQARNPLQTTDGLSETIENLGHQGSRTERTKGIKRDSSHLVAKALELDMEVKKVVGDGEGFFDCNICLDMARDPILTCCGHLFCWACFYQLPHVYSTAKECPVCKGEVTVSNVTPIYGNGNVPHVSEAESGVKVPPRPRANRVESVRQQRVHHRVSPIPVADALHRIRFGLSGATGDRPPQQDAMLAGSRRHRTRQFSRTLSETAASLSSASPPTNVPRLFDNLVSNLHDGYTGRRGQDIPANGGELLSGSDVVQLQHQVQNSGIDVVVQAQHQVLDSTDETNLLSAFDLVLENPVTDTPVEMTVNESQPSSSSRRRNRLSRVSGTENGVSHEPRRRRLG